MLNSYSFSNNFEWPYYVSGYFFLLYVSEIVYCSNRNAMYRFSDVIYRNKADCWMSVLFRRVKVAAFRLSPVGRVTIDEDDKTKIKLNVILHAIFIIGNVAKLNGSPFC